MPFFAVVWMIVASSMQGSEVAAFPERVVRSTGAFTIEYSRGDEAYADELARRLADYSVTGPMVSAEASGSTAAKLRSRKNELLRAVATWLSLGEPSAKMVEIYDHFAGLPVALNPSEIQRPKHFALWRRVEIFARLRAGETVRNFRLEGENGLFFSLGADLGETGRNAAGDGWRRFWDEMVMPISIGADDAEAVEAEIDRGLQRVETMVGDVVRAREDVWLAPFIMLHEVTEVAIIHHYITSEDRRWFCDGVANYVAWKTLADAIGAEEARQHYDLDTQLAQFAGEREDVDLERWPAAENLGGANYREDLNAANYAFATKAIADICARHGDAILPKLFAEIGKTPRENTSMRIVYEAFEKLTGEDMRGYLPKVDRRQKAG